MPNPTDESRLAATTKGGVVVNLDEYKARAGNASVASPVTLTSLAGGAFWTPLLVVLGLCFFLALFLHRR